VVHPGGKVLLTNGMKKDFRFQEGGVQTAVLITGEESGWVLWVEGDGSFVSHWWKCAGSGALMMT